MKRNKKGFTIVELVIVVAIIAILSAVLIPTFSGIVQRANFAADQATVRNMNTVVTTTSILEDGLEDHMAVRRALDNAGFSAERLTPSSKDHKFYWNKPNNEVILVDCSNADSAQWKVVYPENSPSKEDFENVATRDLTNFELASLPKAEMTVLGGAESTIDPTSINWSIGAALPDPFVLDAALKFTATETPEEAQNSAYGGWYVDFKITLNDDINAFLNGGTTIALYGEYATYSAAFCVDQLVANEMAQTGTPVGGDTFYLFQVMSAMVSSPITFTYYDICAYVQEFACGIAAWGGNVEDLAVKLELVMYETIEEYEARTNARQICVYNHSFAEITE